MAAEHDHAAEPEPEPASRPRIVVTFDGVGLANHTVTLDRVEPAQVYAAAFMLDALARELRSGSLIKEALAPGGLGAGIDLAAILGGQRG